MSRETKIRRKNAGTSVRIVVPTHLYSFVNVFMKVNHISRQTSIVAILDYFANLMTAGELENVKTAERLRANTHLIEQIKAIKSDGGLTIDDGTRKAMFDIMQSHPCRKYLQYAD